jgi:signal transduction histidine kinase
VTVSGPSTPVVTEPVAVLATVAALLADGHDLPEALEVLLSGLALRGVALRSAAGDLLATAGDVLRDSTAPVLEVAVAERDAIADGLHDGPVQALVVARLAADAAVRGGDVPAARDATQAALVELRRALWQIRPRGSDGVLEALQQLSVQRVDAGIPALGLVVEPEAVLTGRAGSLAYQVVQAAAGSDCRVAVRSDGPSVVVDVDGGPLSCGPPGPAPSGATSMRLRAGSGSFSPSPPQGLRHDDRSHL